MRIKSVFAFLFAVALASTALAGTKISGTQNCKSEAPTPVAIPDQPNHAFAIVKAQCTWPKPIEMAGTQVKEGAETIQTEMSGNNSSDHGYYLGTMSNGDTFTVKFGGAGHSKDGKPAGGEGTWSFTGGTGKLKGLKGSGKYKGTANADGTMTTQIDGEYSTP
jgi:hypothetical protein